MKHAGKLFKTLVIALKEVEPFVRNGKHLQTGKTFAKLNRMRPQARLKLAAKSPYIASDEMTMSDIENLARALCQSAGDRPER